MLSFRGFGVTMPRCLEDLNTDLSLSLDTSSSFSVGTNSPPFLPCCFGMLTSKEYFLEVSRNQGLGLRGSFL